MPTEKKRRFMRKIRTENHAAHFGSNFVASNAIQRIIDNGESDSLLFFELHSMRRKLDFFTTSLRLSKKKIHAKEWTFALFAAPLMQHVISFLCMQQPLSQDRKVPWNEVVPVGCACSCIRYIIYVNELFIRKVLLTGN